MVASDMLPISQGNYSASLSLISIDVHSWPDTETNLFVIGPSRLFGTIDEVQLWTSERSQAEISASTNHRLRGDEAGLAGYWRFDEGPGGATADITGRGNRLLIYNSPRWVVSTVPLW